MEPVSSCPVAAGDLVAGKFRVERVLGQGGMGVVVAATHVQLDQRVALKFLLPEVMAHPEIVERFLREARASVRIHSEHVARVMDVGTLESGVPFMVMEFLEGEDLEQVLRRGPLPVADAVGFVLEACEAVAEAHALGMMHRDLKPANLFLARRPSGRPTVKVLDFGISKIPATERDRAMTKTSTVMGSPSYMSPEQMISSDKVDARSDIWSLGVVLYELLGQRLPFPGTTMPEVVAAILHKAPEPLAAARPDAPPALVALVDRCLQKDPAVRFANVAELARAVAPFGPRRAEQSVERIETVLGIGPTSTLLVAPPEAAAITGPGDGGTFIPTTAQGARPASRLLVPAVIAVLVVAAGAGGLALRMHAGSGALPLSQSPAGAQSATSAPSVLAAPTPPSAATAATLVPVADEPTASAPASAPTATPHHGARPARSGATKAPGSPTSSGAAPAASCHVVSYYDANGDQHFREDCH